MLLCACVWVFFSFLLPAPLSLLLIVLLPFTPCAIVAECCFAVSTCFAARQTTLSERGNGNSRTGSGAHAGVCDVLRTKCDTELEGVRVGFGDCNSSNGFCSQDNGIKGAKLGTKGLKLK